MPDTNATTVARETVDSVVIRFAGDSGDGMQLTGTQFTTTSALAGNDLATFPDYPAEIRAPAGTLPGVSGFQVHFANHDVYTPGDVVDVLVAMNPAALAVNLAGLPAMSVPAGQVNGLPVGLQLIGQHFDESRLLNVAHQLQQASDWHLQLPPEAGL